MTGAAPWGAFWGGDDIRVGGVQHRAEFHQVMGGKVRHPIFGVPACDASRHRVFFYVIIQLYVIAHTFEFLITE